MVAELPAAGAPMAADVAAVVAGSIATGKK